VLDALPATSTGKILKHKLAESLTNVVPGPGATKGALGRAV
jgi:hypothetical protein